ncbi:glycosyltransferase family 4 protein [Glaciimonas immobilis]|uniref:Glycosyltransferase involved in cell wall biosynthesis n=1 Tax=Glaciimonas immobilis TaxID=728004 RepID=A0A840RPR4_9BURK|nr:glycosyltransferase family 4 protein [Glaciimonas immobilis]KAF3998160.1 glycosyltransferase family 4 protein [Glaciimonas immobilis]MBB5199132.1 glycosyltransferase involved in cell wall biosynthesis [Glaciimonas immobilis]
MKILLVSEDIPSKTLGGLGKHVIALGNALIAAGHEVSLMGCDTPSYILCAEEMGFQGKFIAAFGNPLRGWKESQLGFFNSWKRPYFAKKMAKKIQSYAKSFDVVHYHGHQPMVGRYIAPWVNFVQTRHDQGGDCITNVRFRHGEICVERSPAECAKCIHPSPGLVHTKLSAHAVQRYRDETSAAFELHPVVFVSEFLRKNYALTMPKVLLEKTIVIHNFVNEDLLGESLFTKQTEMNTTTFHIHVAGRLDAGKGISTFLDLIEPRLPSNWRVDVYGDGPLREMIDAKYVDSLVRIHGYCSYPEVVAATRNANVVVVPSMWEEACGTTIIEALRLGKICYALRRGGTSELASYGQSNQLRLFDDLTTLTDALLTANDFTDRTGGESADVRLHVLKLLPVYARNKRSA